jgi:hypothetical protein
MKATPQPVNLQDFPALWVSPTTRSRGVHVSNIIRGIALEMGILKKELADEIELVDVREITDPVAILRISIGLAWEAWYIPQILSEQQGVVKHPGEMKVDGVYMSPDGESVDVIITPGNGHHLRIHEVKATYKSTKTVGDLSGQWMWLTQLAAYCKGARTNHARIHVLFLCGDYKFPLKPELRIWDVEFTREEIDERWSLLKDYKKFKEEK